MENIADKILVSACLAGEACRYDGKDLLIPEIARLVAAGRAVPVCPERAGGLPTPRPPAERQAQKVISIDGADVTGAFQRGAQEALRLAREHGCRLAVLKSESPSCGRDCIYDGTFSGTLTQGNGVTVELLQQNGITVFTEHELDRLP